MAFVKSCCRLARISHQNVAATMVGARRNYSTEISLTFASPSEAFYIDAKVKQVDVPSIAGDFGVIAQHVPTLGVLRPGVLVVHEDEAVNKYFVSSGSVTVNSDSSVQILAEEAVPVDRLDASAIREGLSQAQAEMNAAANEKAKQEAQIAVTCYEAMQAAV